MRGLRLALDDARLGRSQSTARACSIQKPAPAARYSDAPIIVDIPWRLAFEHAFPFRHDSPVLPSTRRVCTSCSGHLPERQRKLRSVIQDRIVLRPMRHGYKGAWNNA